LGRIDIGQEMGRGKNTLRYMCILGYGRSIESMLPTFSEMIHYYGPYIGLVLSIIIAIVVLQFVWFNKVLKAKNEEIKRLVEREQKLNDRNLFMISEEIGYNWKEK
jgi:hypothetical protein